MKTLTVTEVARDFGKVLDDLEHDQEEIILVRNQRQVARLVPEPPALNALEVLGDLAGTMDEGTADALSTAMANARPNTGTLSQLRNPWDF